jgi:hypothetical protein
MVVPGFDAKVRVHRRDDVLEPVRVILWNFAFAVAAANDLAHPKVASGHQNTHQSPPVVAADGLVHTRRTAEFAHGYDEYLLIEPPLVKGADEGGQAFVVGRALGFHAVRNLVMVIPTADGDGHIIHARLHQSPREQHRLPRGVASVACSGLKWVRNQVGKLYNDGRLIHMAKDPLENRPFMVNQDGSNGAVMRKVLLQAFKKLSLRP